MTLKFAGLSLTLLLVTTATTLAQSASPPATPAAETPPAATADAPADGATLYRTKSCVACHGRNGARGIQNFPELAGQNKDYLYAQVKDIASGARLSGKDARGYPRTQGMKDVMHLVTDAEIKTITAWLAEQPAPKPRALTPPPDQATLDKGKAAYTQGGCQTCHGAEGLKPQTGYPMIGGMKRDYLVLQIQEMRDGIRTNGKSKLMLPFAKRLKDEQVELIATYLSQVERTAP